MSRIEMIPIPFDGQAAENERFCKERIAELEQKYRREAEPYISVLVELERFRRYTHLAVE